LKAVGENVELVVSDFEQCLLAKHLFFTLVSWHLGKRECRWPFRFEKNQINSTSSC